jgi:hypothetical protein
LIPTDNVLLVDEDASGCRQEVLKGKGAIHEPIIKPMDQDIYKDLV